MRSERKTGKEEYSTGMKNKSIVKERTNLSVAKDVLAIASFALIVVWAFRDLIGRGMLAYGDMSPYPESIGDALQFLTSGYWPISHGMIHWIDYAIVLRIVLIFICGGNAALAQKVGLMFPIILGFISMYYFLGCHVVKSRIARYVASFIYIVNPLTIGSPFIGGAMGWLYVYSLFPFLIHTLFNMSDSRRGVKSRYYSALLFSVLLVLSIGYGPFVVLFIAPFVLYVLLDVIVSRNMATIKATLKVFTVALVPSCILLYPTYGHMFSYIVSYFVPFLFSAPLGYGVKTASLGVTYYLTFPPFDIITLQPPSAPELGWGYNVFGVVLPVLAFSSLLFKQKRKLNLLFASMAILIITFIYLANRDVIFWLFHVFRFLAIMPNSDLPSLFIVFAYSPMLATTIEQIVKWVKKKANARDSRLDEFLPSHKPDRTKAIFHFFTPHKSVACTLILLLLMSNLALSWPFLRGDMGVFLLRSEEKALISPDFYQIASFIDEKRGEDVERTLWLPSIYSETEIKTRFLDPYVFDTPYGLERWFTLNLSYHLYETLWSVFEKKVSTKLGSLVAPLDVRYIIVNLASKATGSPQVDFAGNLYGDPKVIAGILDNQDDLKLIVNTSQYLIYENRNFIPLLTAFNGGFYVESTSNLSASDVIRLFCTLPNFNISNQLLVFADTLTPSQNEFFSNKLNSVLVLRCERNISTIFMESHSDFHVQKNNHYRIVCPWLGDRNLTLEVDNVPVMIRRVENTSWHESEALNLTEGTHSLTLEVPLRKPRGIVAWWLPDVSTTDVFCDLSGNENNGYIHGATMIDEELGKALLLDDYDYIEVPLSESLNVAGNITVEAWIKPTKGGVNTIIDRCSNPESGERGFLFRTNNYDLELQLFLESGTAQFIAEEIVFHDDWQHVAFTFDSSSVRFFHNGEKAAEFDLPEPELLPASVYPLIIGRKYAVDFPQQFEGSLYEIRIYNKSLTTEEISTDYGEWIKEENIPERIVIFESDNGASIEEMLNQDFRRDIHVSSYSWAEYNTQIEADQPVFIFFGEPYHDQWNAYLRNGEKLAHFPAYLFLNGYIIEESGSLQVRISFDEQATFTMYLYISAVSWLAIVVVIAMQYDPLMRTLKSAKKAILRHKSKARNLHGNNT